MPTSLLTDLSIFQGSSLCVVGNLNRDIKTAPFDATALLDDGESPVESIVESIGGGGANSACIASTLGANTSFLAKVGDDSLGRRLQRTLQRQKVQTQLTLSSQHPTGSSLALNYASGRRHFVSCLPASQSLAYDDIRSANFRSCKHLLRADIWFSSEMLFDGNKELLQRARAEGLATSVDLNWDPQWGHAPEQQIAERKKAARAMLPWVNLAHGNARELIEFSGALHLEGALQSLLEWGVQAVVVHLGEGGAGYYDKSCWIVEPAVLAPRHIHSVGTGDVLSVVMMLLHERVELSVPERLHLANMIVAEYIGGQREFIPRLVD